MSSLTWIAAALNILACADVRAQEAALVVAEKVAGAVGFYSTDGRRVAGVTVGSHPHEILFSPDRKLLYVTDNGVLWMTDAGTGGNTISIVDVAARKRVGVIDLGKYHRPHGIDLDRKTGRLVVTVEGPDALLLVDPAERKVLKAYDTEGKSPHMVILGPGGEWAYVSNSGSGSVAAIRLSSGEVKLIPCGANPQGGAFTENGKTLYMTDSESDTISIIDAEKKQRIGTIPTGKQPVRIEIAADGHTLVYGLQNGEAVGFADTQTRREAGQVALGGKPLSLTLSTDRRTAYSGVQDKDKIYVISVADRKIVRVIDTPKGSGPDPVLELR